MKHQRIYATNDPKLVDNSIPKKIGFTKDGQRYLSNGVIIPFIVVFNFGTNHQDLFFFENHTLVYSNIYIGREDFLRLKYSELAKRKEITPGELVKEIVDCYSENENK